MRRPDVLLITVDAMRADLAGPSPAGTLPALDRLAGRSVRFTQAAFPVLLTSTRASMYGGCLGPRYGYARGFESFVELEPEGKDPALRRVKGGQRLLRSRAFQWLPRAAVDAGRQPAAVLGAARRGAGGEPSGDRALAPFRLLRLGEHGA